MLAVRFVDESHLVSLEFHPRRKRPKTHGSETNNQLLRFVSRLIVKSLTVCIAFLFRIIRRNKNDRKSKEKPLTMRVVTRQSPAWKPQRTQCWKVLRWVELHFRLVNQLYFLFFLLSSSCLAGEKGKETFMQSRCCKVYRCQYSDGFSDDIFHGDNHVRWETSWQRNFDSVWSKQQFQCDKRRSQSKFKIAVVVISFCLFSMFSPVSHITSLSPPDFKGICH